jgi:hypothetical protein
MQDVRLSCFVDLTGVVNGGEFQSFFECGHAK